VTANHLLGGQPEFVRSRGLGERHALDNEQIIRRVTKIKRLDCYPEESVILTQLGVIGNLSAAFEH